VPANHLRRWLNEMNDSDEAIDRDAIVRQLLTRLEIVDRYRAKHGLLPPESLGRRAFRWTAEPALGLLIPLVGVGYAARGGLVAMHAAIVVFVLAGFAARRFGDLRVGGLTAVISASGSFLALWTAIAVLSARGG
jgi:hypothetical protein